MRRPTAYTLVELLIVVAVLAALTFIAVPRLQFGAVRQRQAEVAASRILSALRQTRSLAIINAVDHPGGYALRLSHTGGKWTFEIVDVAASAVVESQCLDPSVTCAGTSQFTFTSLGALSGGDASLSLSSGGTTCTVTVVGATGTARCEEGA
jgi:Tfp pilus assembly protein FimT